MCFKAWALVKGRKLPLSAGCSAHVQMRQQVLWLPPMSTTLYQVDFPPPPCASPNSHALFFPSGGDLWLHKGQRRRALISGRCHHLCHQEKRWRLVWGCHEWSDRALPRELCGVDHALLGVKTRGQNHHISCCRNCQGFPDLHQPLGPHPV